MRTKYEIARNTVGHLTEKGVVKGNINISEAERGGESAQVIMFSFLLPQSQPESWLSTTEGVQVLCNSHQ